MGQTGCSREHLYGKIEIEIYSIDRDRLRLRQTQRRSNSDTDNIRKDRKIETQIQPDTNYSLGPTCD